MSDVKSKVMSIIVDKLGVAEDEVSADASFTNDLGANCRRRCFLHRGECKII